MRPWIRRYVLAALMVVVAVSLMVVLLRRAAGPGRATEMSPVMAEAAPTPGPWVSLFDSAGSAEVVCIGEILRVNGNDGQIRVKQVLKGDPPSKTLSVDLLIEAFPSDYQRRYRGREAVFFLNPRDADRWLVLVSIWLPPGSRQAGLEAADRALAIAAMEDDEARVRAILAEAASPNEHLRMEAQSYIREGLRYHPDPQRLKDEIARLFRSDEEDVRLAGLEGLHYVRADELVPELLPLAGDWDDHVARAAASALAQYDTSESVAALMGMAGHPDPYRRAQAAEALGESQRPEARRAMASLLDDRIASVREQALREFSTWFEAGDVGDEAFDKIVFMVDDPDDDVGQQAVRALGHSRRPEAVAPLLRVLKADESDAYGRAAALSALAELHPDVGSTARDAIGESIEIILRSLESKVPDECMCAAGVLSHIGTNEARAALKRTAERHADPHVRRVVQKELDRLSSK